MDFAKFSDQVNTRHCLTHWMGKSPPDSTIQNASQSCLFSLYRGV